MKKITTLLLSLILIFTLVACSGNTTDFSSAIDIAQPAAASAGTGETSVTSQQTIAATAVPTPEVDYDPEDLDSAPLDADGATLIQLNSTGITVEGSGSTVDGSNVTISAAGTYQISGTLKDGQIIVDTTDAEKVTLVLNGVDITSLNSAPIYVVNAEKVILTLADGSQNVVTDGDTYLALDESGEPNAAIFSHDDLTINGSGTLTVNANYNNGIASKDDLKITGGTITVNAVNDGVKGKDSVAIKDGIVTINSGADGIQSTNADEAEKGYILIEGGTLDITSGLDGIQAETSLLVSGGNLTITSGGGSVNNSTTGGGIWGGPGMEGNPNKPTESAKGLKAGADITIMAGTFNINSADDSIHSNANLTINGGSFLLTSGDDGMHADSTLTINQGEINITQSYEGIESAVLTINEGTIHVTSSDDGLNAAGGNDGSSVGGRPGQNMFDASGDYQLNINGGYLYVDAFGDGLDINGPIEMTNGVVIVNGPTANNNGPVDYAISFNITGGYLLAVGSSGMAQTPSETSTQYSLMYNFDTVQATGTLVHIETQSGKEILTFEPTKEYQSVLLSSSELQNGETYVVYAGGSSTGAVTDALYAGGVYTPGTQVTSLTISSIVTSTGMMGGGPGVGRPGGGGGPDGMPPPRP